LRRLASISRWYRLACISAENSRAIMRKQSDMLWQRQGDGAENVRSYEFMIGVALSVIIALFGFIGNLSAKRHERTLQKLAKSESILQAETQRLALSEQRFANLSSHIDGALYRMRAQAPYQDLFISAGIEKLCGLELMEFLAQRESIVRDMVVPEDRERVRKALEHALITGTRTELEYRMRRADGSIIWVHDRCTPSEPDANGRMQFIDGILLDVTDSKATENRLAETEARVQHLIESIDEVFYTCRTDENWTATYLSPSFERMTGYSVGEIVGNRTLSLGDLVHPDDREICFRVGSEAQGKPFEMTYRLITKSGDVRWIFERGCAAQEITGGRKLVSGVMIDITKQKELEVAVNERDQRLASFARTLDGVIYRVEAKPPYIFK